MSRSGCTHGIPNRADERHGAARENDVPYTHSPQQYGELISHRRSGATAFHHYDALGSTERLTDPNGAASVSYLHKAFGDQSVLSGSHADPFTWVGRLEYYRQADMGNYWLRARTYSQLTGRFLSRDPMPNGNRYIYPGNSPVVLVDRSRMQGCRGEECRRQRRGPRGRGLRGRYLRPRGAAAVASRTGAGGSGRRRRGGAP